MRAESEVESALSVVEAAPIVQTRRAIILADALKEATEQRTLLVRYVKLHMRENVDYGTIPGTPKPSLWKAGAEKLTELYRCTPKFTIIEKTVDWEKGFFHYTFRCRLMSRDSSSVLAEGFGSCSSRETKYRWRDGKRRCPKCEKDTALIKGKEEYGGGWICFAKKGGCGAKFVDADPAIVGQVVGKVENPDAADVVNTVLKMGKKRAHVDGAIALAGCSDLFTQDLEDMPLPEALPERDVTPPAPAAPAKSSRAAQVQAAMKPVAVIDVKAGETEEAAKARHSTRGAFSGLNDKQLSAAIDETRSRLGGMTAGTKTHEAMKERLKGLEEELNGRLPPAEAAG